MQTSSNRQAHGRPTGGLCRNGRLLAAAVVLALSGVAQATDHRDGGRSRGDDAIEGLWNVQVRVFNCATGLGPTFDALALYEAGGTFHDTNATDPRLRSSSFGVWRRMGHRTYEFAFKFFRFDAQGLPIGPQVVRQTVRLAEDKQSYTAEGGSEFFNPDGSPVIAPDGNPLRGCSSSTGTRFR